MYSATIGVLYFLYRGKFGLWYTIGRVDLVLGDSEKSHLKSRIGQAVRILPSPCSTFLPLHLSSFPFLSIAAAMTVVSFSLSLSLRYGGESRLQRSHDVVVEALPELVVAEVFGYVSAWELESDAQPACVAV